MQTDFSISRIKQRKWNRYIKALKFENDDRARYFCFRAFSLSKISFFHSIIYEYTLHSHYFHRCCKHAQGNEKQMGWQEPERYFLQWSGGRSHADIDYVKNNTARAHTEWAQHAQRKCTQTSTYIRNAERVRARSNIIQLTFRTQSSKSTTIRMRKSQFLMNETRVLWSAFSMSTPLMDKITSPMAHTQENN